MSRRRARPVRRRHGLPPWRRWFPVLAALVLLLLAPVIAHAQAGSDSLTLRWTAVGDDGAAGTAALYDLRVAAEPITEASWDAAAPLERLPAPLPAGTAQQVVVRGLSAGATYWFALRVRDDAGNWSPLSNLVRWDGSADASPPAAPGGVAVEPRGGGFHLTWSPSPAPDLAGYSVYRASSAAGPYARLNEALVLVPEYQDDAAPAGTTPWYRVTATDASGNESAQAAPAAAGAAGAATWAIGPAWPNPSRAGETVRLALELRDGSARLDLCDAAGHLVRRIGLDGLGAGNAVVEWDGRNDDGRAVAPGAYRAWLVAGGTRRGVRLVRLP